MRIIALSENTSENGRLATEHGLSVYVETEACRILFDTGQGELFAENAEKCGVDLTAVDLAVISHGHYGHGGGLRRFLALNQRAPIYVSPYAFKTHLNREGAVRFPERGDEPAFLSFRRNHAGNLWECERIGYV